MAINKITKLDLESRAIALKGKDMSYSEIAAALSNESNEVITFSSVQRFFASRDKAKAQAVEKSDKLKAKVAEAEINTIEEAMYCITTLKEICEDAKKSKDYKTAMQAIDRVYPALDIINKILGKYQTSPQNQFNFTEVNLDGARERIISRIAGIASRTGQVVDTEFIEP